MDGEVDLRDGFLLLYRADSIVNLANALLILGHGRLGRGAVSVHFEGRETAVYDELWKSRGGAIVSIKRAAIFAEREKWLATVWREKLGTLAGRGRKIARLRSVGGEG